jgi:threonine dehydratase
VRRITQHSGGTMVAVSEAEIRESRDLVAELEGIRVCFSAATAVAGLIRARSDAEVPLKDTVLVNLTGSDRDGTPPAERTHWVHRSGDRWDFAALDGLAPRR